MKQLKTKLYNINDIINISGVNEKNFQIFKEIYNIDITVRGEEILVNTDDLQLIEKLDNLFSGLSLIASKCGQLKENDITYIILKYEENKFNEVIDLYLNRKKIATTSTGKPIYPKTEKQLKYLKALEENDLIFAVGSAGTGKTYLAVLEAVKLLKQNSVKKIILTRPAVEAGESLGFLPGDLREKIDPYLKPLYDALYDLLGYESTEACIEKKQIEIAPLAYMRGRTLENACVILDEAQNTTKMQMKMFLTRLGFQSKMIVTGDISQTDLPRNEKSGFKHAIELLRGMKGLEIIEFENYDVIRHPLVSKILSRYEKDEN